MSRILLVDDSPHAQRIGERILADEGFEVVTVSNADSALIRLEDADPDVVIAKAMMPGRSGYDISRYIRMSPRHRHVRVILTAGVTETLDNAELERAAPDGTLKKPFEASALLSAVRPLVEAASNARSGSGSPQTVAGAKAGTPNFAAPVIAVIDPEQVRAAVTVALDASMAAMIDEITNRVMAALTARRAAGEKIESRPAAPTPPQAASAPPVPPAPIEPARPVSRVTASFGQSGRQTLRVRPGSILGLDAGDKPGSPES